MSVALLVRVEFAVMSGDKSEKLVTFEQQALPLMPQLYGAALRWTRNPSDAEDLVQETFAKAFAAWDKFQQGTNLITVPARPQSILAS